MLMNLNPPARRRLLCATLLTLSLFTTAAADDLAILPTIGVLWVAGDTPATAELFLAPGMSSIPNVLGIRSNNPDIEVVDFSLYPDSQQLFLDLRLTNGRAADLDSVVVEYRSQPAKEMLVGALRLVPATGGGSEVTWARASTAADIGMIFSGALLNSGEAPIRVRGLTYAPDAIGQGLVLVRLGPPAAFGDWSDRVMQATASARWPAPEANRRTRLFGRSGAATTPTREPMSTPGSADYRVALADALPDSRWADSGEMDIEIPAGQSLFVAITVASFRYDISGLALAITPVATVETPGGCCLEVGAGIAAVTRGDMPF